MANSSEVSPSSVQTNDLSTDATCFPVFGTASGSQIEANLRTSPSLRFNSVTGLFASTKLQSDTPITAVNTFAINGTGPGAQQDGLYIADLGTVFGATKNPTFTAGIFAQVNASRSIGYSCDSGYMYGFYSSSGPGTYGWISRVYQASRLDANTPFAVLVGGTSSVGAAQSVDSAGVQGQFLASAGASAKPIMRAIGYADLPYDSPIQLVSVLKTNTFSTTATNWVDWIGLLGIVTTTLPNTRVLVRLHGGVSNSATNSFQFISLWRSINGGAYTQLAYGLPRGPEILCWIDASIGDASGSSFFATTCKMFSGEYMDYPSVSAGTVLRYQVRVVKTYGGISHFGGTFNISDFNRSSIPTTFILQELA